MPKNSSSGSSREETIIKDKKGNTLFYEEVLERVAGHVLMSNCRPATQEEIDEAAKQHSEGKCPHVIFYDEPGWLYDFRICHTCGGGLGLI